MFESNQTFGKLEKAHKHVGEVMKKHEANMEKSVEKCCLLEAKANQAKDEKRKPRMRKRKVKRKRPS